MSQTQQPKLGAPDRNKVWAYFKYCDDYHDNDDDADCEAKFEDNNLNDENCQKPAVGSGNSTQGHQSGGVVAVSKCKKPDVEKAKHRPPVQRVRCILCKKELCNTSILDTGDTDFHIKNGSLSQSTLSQATTSTTFLDYKPKSNDTKQQQQQYQNQHNSIDILWKHIKSKHSQLYYQLKNNNNNITSNNYHHNNIIAPTSGFHPKQANGDSPSSLLKYECITKQIELGTSSPNRINNKTKAMTPTRQPRRELKNQRLNLDFIDYNDLTLTSMKPSPSSSLSSNLMSRLTQLSSPVTRKLKFWNKKSFQVNQYDPSFKVIYLGNLGMQLWSKDESCLDKPLGTLWSNYLVNMKTEIVMRLTICNSGLKAITRQHGLTQYWSNRLVYCCSHKNYPKIFSWIYRHEGKKMRQELRCHAVLCSSPEKSTKMVTMLNQRLACALQEFRREKKSRGMSVVIDNLPSSQQEKMLPRTVPLRRQILAKGSANFRPPLERSKSAPKLTSIMEDEECDSESLEESHEEFEYEQSFGELDEDEEDDENEEDFEEGSNTYVESSSSRARDVDDVGSHHYADTLNTTSSSTTSDHNISNTITTTDLNNKQHGHDISTDFLAKRANDHETEVITPKPPPVDLLAANGSSETLESRQLFTQSDSQEQHQKQANNISPTTKEESEFGVTSSEFSRQSRRKSRDSTAATTTSAPQQQPKHKSHILNEGVNSANTSANMRSSSSSINNKQHISPNNGESTVMLSEEKSKKEAKNNNINSSSNSTIRKTNNDATEDLTQDIVSSWSNFVIK